MTQESGASNTDIVLRIAVIRSGMMVGEHKFKDEDVVLGPDTRLGPPDESRPEWLRGHVLFKREGNKYLLNLIDGMIGRAIITDESTNLGVYAKGAANGTRTLELTEKSRGKVIVGETAYNFQFVVPPPSSHRPPRLST